MKNTQNNTATVNVILSKENNAKFEKGLISQYVISLIEKAQATEIASNKSKDKATSNEKLIRISNEIISASEKLAEIEAEIKGLNAYKVNVIAHNKEVSKYSATLKGSLRNVIEVAGAITYGGLTVKEWFNIILKESINVRQSKTGRYCNYYTLQAMNKYCKANNIQVNEAAHLQAVAQLTKSQKAVLGIEE